MGLIKPAQLRAVAECVPDAMRPSWMHDAWAGTHGSARLRVDPYDLRSNLLVDAKGITGDARMNAHVRDPAEHQVGQVTRTIRLHESGRLEIHHDYLRLQPEMQGTGFARAFNDKAFARYADAGVDDVTILAALSVGGYAWARQGFELLAEGADDTARALERGEQIRSLVTNAAEDGSITARQFARLEPRLVPKDATQLPPRALTSVQELAAMPSVGRKVLLGQSWDGVRPIEHSAPWWGARIGQSDLLAGVSYLDQPEVASAALVDAGRGMAALLPESFDPAVAGRAFERSLARVTDVASGSTSSELRIRLGRGDRVEEMLATNTVPTSTGTAKTRVRWTPEGGLTASDQFRGDRTRATRDAMSRAWNDLGIETVHGNDTKRLRSTAAALR